MDFVIMLLVVGLTFGICFLADKGFTKLFRSKAQHTTGLSVRLNKKYGAFGLILFVLGLGSVFAGLKDGWVLLAGGGLIMVVGIGMIVYYLSNGIYYDEESFLHTAFLRSGRTYRYGQIVSQRLYVVQGGNVLVELHMDDEKAVQVQCNAVGAQKFLDHAFAGWCRQKGLKAEDCPFHDPDNSCWFPNGEE